MPRHEPLIPGRRQGCPGRLSPPDPPWIRGRAGAIAAPLALEVAAMDFSYTPEQERFRAELRDFLARALPPGWGN